jgi:hypothetical protein
VHPSGHALLLNPLQAQQQLPVSVLALHRLLPALLLLPRQQQGL